MPNALPPPLAALETDLGYEEGELEGVDLRRAERALQSAATLILAEVAPATAERWKDDAPDVVVLVAITAARRGFENPRGISQETLGAHTVGLSDTTGVYLTAQEVAQVVRAATGRRTATGYTGSLRTPSAYDVDGYVPGTIYVPVYGQRPVPLLTAADVLTGGSAA